MTAGNVPRVSVCIATRDRAAMLAEMLRSLDKAQAAADVDCETLVVDNGSTDATAQVLDAWVAGRARGSDQRRRLFCAEPGQSRALNYALQHAQAPLLALTDDDVEVTRGWLQAIVHFFDRHPQYDAAMGRVLLSPAVTDAGLIARVKCYETLPLFDRGDVVCDVAEMFGANMILRRRALDAVGMFDERLGPGATGFGGDTDLSERIVRAERRIGYIPDAIVYHAIDAGRLTPEFFRDYHLRKARGDFQRARDRFCRKNLSRWCDATLRYAWCSLVGDGDRRLRARMRMIRHRELLRLQWRARLGASRLSGSSS